MLVVGITGGIGSGKTAICQEFSRLNIPIYLADERAKLLQNQSPLREKIQELLGTEVYEKGVLLRQKVADIVFSNPDKLQALSKLVHPIVASDFDSWLQHQKAPFVLKESAILLEKGRPALYDFIIVVTAPLNVRIQRVMQRDGISAEKVAHRLDNQMTDESRLKLADFEIKNDQWSETKHQINNLYQRLISSSKTTD